MAVWIQPSVRVSYDSPLPVSCIRIAGFDLGVKRLDLVFERTMGIGKWER